MGIPAIKLNLAPPPTLWRLHHGLIAWIVFTIGAIGLTASIVATVRAYQEADRAGKKTVAITDQARTAQRQQAMILDELREIRVDQEMPRWRLAERILQERALPWSRITAELERSLVHNVRIKSIQRSRDADHNVLLKLRGESRNQEAEAEFIVSLHKNLAFAQIILERESEIANNRQGGLEFDYNLHLSTEPPAYELLPLYGPERKTSQQSGERTQEPPSSKPPQQQPSPQSIQQPAPQPVQQPVPQSQRQPEPSPRPVRERPPRPDRRDPSSRRLVPSREGR